MLIMALSQFCGINAMIYYSTEIFAAAGGGHNAAFTSSVWMGLINLVFTFVAIALVDQAGRKPLLLIGTAVQTLALGLVGWMFLHPARRPAACCGYRGLHGRLCDGDGTDLLDPLFGDLSQ